MAETLRYPLAAASLGAGLIHVTAVFDHTDHPAPATFFVLLAAAQIGWAASVAVRRPSEGTLKTGAVLSAGVVIIWLLSRTVGLAGVPGAEEVEPVGLRDGIATALQALPAIGVAARFASERLASGLAMSAVGIMTAAALAAPGHGHHHHGAVEHPHAGLEFTADHHPDEGRPAHAHVTGSPAVTHHHGAAGEHGADQPGHVHDPSHHRHHGPASEATAGHGGAALHGPLPHHPGHEVATGSEPRHHHVTAPTEQGAGHDHDADSAPEEPCSNPLPDNRPVATVQEIADFYLGGRPRCVELSSPPHSQSP